MAAIVVGIVSTLITIGSTVYSVVKTIYDWIVAPLTKAVDIINNVRDIIRGVVETIQGKLDYVLEITKADIFIDLVHGISEFTKLAEDIAKGNKEALLKVIGNLYSSIAGVGKDIIHILSESLKPITDRIEYLQNDIKRINEFSIKKLTDNYVELAKEVKQMNANLIDTFREEIDREINWLKDLTEGKIRTLERDIRAVEFKVEDLDTFTRMYLRMMER